MRRLRYENSRKLEEYIAKLQGKRASVGEIRLANRGLEALMWYRDEVASKKLSDLWDSNSSFAENKSFKEKLYEDSFYSAATEMYDNVHELVRKANYENLWSWTNLSSKISLLDKWGYTMMVDSEDIHDENSTFPFHSKRELKIFEKIMGREFEEFDLVLR